MTRVPNATSSRFFTFQTRHDPPHCIAKPKKMLKPFKSPLLMTVKKPTKADLTLSNSDAEIQPRPYKKRRLLVHHVPQSPPKSLPSTTTAVNASRKPLLTINNPIKSSNPSSAVSEGPEGCYMVLWYASFHSLLYDR